MSRSLDNLVINPLYYDLLSGEFMPVSDREGRSHTMARLAVAAYMKGHKDEDERVVHFEYIPSWAPRVSARIITEPQDTNTDKLTGVSLAINGGYNCLDLDYSTIDTQPHFRITHENSEHEEFYPIELGPQLTAVQQRVAHYADYFFLRAHPS